MWRGVASGSSTHRHDTQPAPVIHVQTKCHQIKIKFHEIDEFHVESRANTTQKRKEKKKQFRDILGRLLFSSFHFVRHKAQLFFSLTIFFLLLFQLSIITARFFLHYTLKARSTRNVFISRHRNKLVRQTTFDRLYWCVKWGRVHTAAQIEP